MFGKCSHTRITRTHFTKIPISFIALKLEGIFIKGFEIEFCFVETEDVRIFALYKLINNAFINDGSDAVNVPQGNFDQRLGISFTIRPFVKGGRMSRFGQKVGHFKAFAHACFLVLVQRK